jgi:arabinofuranosyltransferase
MPFVIWTCFSIFYYGSPVPNTAAAKLATGIPPIQLMTQGWAYLVASTKFDPTWPLLFGGSLLAGAVGILAKPATLEGRARFAIAAGLVMNLLYVVRVGGDFMTGRFLAPIIFLSVILMARSIPHASRSSWVALATVILVTILLPGAPIRSGLDFRNADARHTGVGDERGIFFEYTSLWLYLNRDPSKAFPDHPWTHEGIALASRGQRVYRRANVGILGYWIGTDKIVIDRLGLTDPFLARLPISGGWRIGHFPRQIPVGYLDSVRTGTNAIEDPRLRQLYEQLKLVTQSDLLAAGRFSAMLQIGSQRPATPGDSGS